MSYPNRNPYNSDSTSNNHRRRNNNSVQFGKGARGFVLDRAEFIGSGGHYYPQGFQSTPEELAPEPPSSSVSMFEEAEDFLIAGGSYMLVAGNVIGNPSSTRNDSHICMYYISCSPIFESNHVRSSPCTKSTVE